MSSFLFIFVSDECKLNYVPFWRGAQSTKRDGPRCLEGKVALGGQGGETRLTGQVFDVIGVHGAF